jgi:hypothetical protein
MYGLSQDSEDELAHPGAPDLTQLTQRMATPPSGNPDQNTMAWEATTQQTIAFSGTSQEPHQPPHDEQETFLHKIIASILAPRLESIDNQLKKVLKQNDKLRKEVVYLRSEIERTKTTHHPTPATEHPQTDHQGPTPTPTPHDRPQTQKTKTSRTYSEVVGTPETTANTEEGLDASRHRPSKTPRTTPTPAKNRKTLVVTRDNTTPPRTDMLTMRNMINGRLKDLEKGKTNISIKAINQSLKGNLIITINDECTIEDILAHENEINTTIRIADENANSIRAQETWSKVIIHSVSLLNYPDSSDGMRKLQDEIHQFNPSCRNIAAPPRYMSNPDTRVGKTASSVVLAFRSDIDARHAVAHGLSIDGKKSRVERFWTARPTDQCSNCQRFGHPHQRCKFEARCRICGGAHPTTQHKCEQCHTKRGTECEKHDTRKCSNCEGDHLASNPFCPIRISLRKSLRRDTPTTDAQLNPPNE